MHRLDTASPFHSGRSLSLFFRDVADWAEAIAAGNDMTIPPIQRPTRDDHFDY
jgi:hypothetical protein